MSFYIFRLENIHVKHRRGNIPDSDVVVFSILVNQLDRGHGTAVFPAMAASVDGVPCSAVRPNNRVNINDGWEIGPLEIEPGDDVHVIYTGTNISDEQLVSLDTQKQDEIEIKLLNAIAAAGIAAVGGLGLVAEAIAGVLSEIGDPVGKLIGFEPQGPCNGPVFSDAVQFSGSGLDKLPMAQLPHGTNATPPLPLRSMTSFTRTYTDETTHDTNICGHIAETDITFLIYRLSFISVKWALSDRFPSHFPSEFGPGLRQHGQSGTAISVKSLLGLRP